MPAFKLEMDDRALKSAYVLMAHDTSHDFFQPKETFRKVISRRGKLEGGAGDDMDEDLSPTPRDPSPRDPSPTGMIPEDDMDEDDTNEIDDEVKWWSIDDDTSLNKFIAYCIDIFDSICNMTKISSFRIILFFPIEG